MQIKTNNQVDYLKPQMTSLIGFAAYDHLRPVWYSVQDFRFAPSFINFVRVAWRKIRLEYICGDLVLRLHKLVK